MVVLPTYIFVRQWAVQDFTQFYDAARLVGRNPYSPTETSALVRDPAHPPFWSVVHLPPYALPLIVPLGWVSYDPSFALFLALNAALLVGCTARMWDFFGGEGLLVPSLTVALFFPALELMRVGQASGLVLAGIVGFVLFSEAKQDWLAGASLWLALFKPHVVLPLLLIIFLWSITNRRWHILLGGAGMVAGASAVAAILYPGALRNYLAILPGLAASHPFPNLGGLLEYFSRRPWTAFLPMILGLAISVLYWLRNKEEWHWRETLPALLILSVTCAYYSYSYDEVLMLPALVAAAARGNRYWYWPAFFIVFFGLAMWGAVTLSWTAAGWAVTYYVVQSQPRLRSVATSSGA